MRSFIRQYRSSLGIALTALFIIGMFTFLMMGFFLPTMEHYIHSQRYEMVERMVELAISDLNSVNEEVIAGRISQEEAKERSIERFRHIRYGEDNTGYFWILNKDPVLIMHPYRPDLEGEIVEEITDLQLGNILAEMVLRITESPTGDGFVKYDWQFNDDSSQIKPKVSFVRAFDPWGWIIGTGAFIDDIENDIAKLRNNILITILLILLLTSLGIIIMTSIAINARNKKEMQDKEILTSEERFKTLFDLLPFSCVINDFNGALLEANQYFCDSAGFSRKAIRGKTLKELNHILDPESYKSLTEELLSTGRLPAREIMIRTDTGMKWLLISSSLIRWQDEKASITATIDITERKQAELEAEKTAERMFAQREALASLAESEAMASGIARNAIPELARQAAKALKVERVGTWIFNEETNEIFNVDQYIASRDEHSSGERLDLTEFPSYWESIRYDTRVDAHDAVTDPRLKELLEDWIIPNGISSLMDASIMQEGHFAGLFSCEHTGPKRQWYADEQAFVSSIAALIGQILATDERRRAEISLRASEESLRATLKSIGDGVIVTDTASRITLMNNVAEEITGWSLAEAKGRKLTEVFNVISEETRQKVPDIVEEAIRAKGIVKLPDYSVLISRDGTEYLVADSGAPIFSEPEIVSGVVLVFRDITTERELQEQLNHIQKMDSIGQLAGGVAHDFNNMLGGIIGGAELLKHSRKVDDDSIKFISLILQSAERAASLTRKLLTFARKQQRTSSPFNIVLLINDVLSFWQSTVDKRIKLHKDIPDEEVIITGDQSDLQNAIMNILINATHAMPRGGDLYITTRFVELDEDRCESNIMEITPGSYIEIEIRDTGCGISPENLKKIFEPFFTTKELGKGTGLGLSSVFGTIQQYKGAIEVQSVVDSGSSFHIFLPLSSEGDQEELRSSDQIFKGSGTILFVDDELVIRETTGTLLNRMGYEILYAENGREALEIFNREAENIDLVILDMDMPEMNGRDCFFEMKRISPEMKILLATGNFQEDKIDAMTTAGLNGILNKPFQSSSISKIIRDTIAE